MKKLHRRRDRFKGISLGLDLHKRVLVYCVMDESGEEVENRRLPSNVAELSALVDRLIAGGASLQVALEASGCFLWAYDLLVEKVGREQVHVAAPSKVRVIAESDDKCDETDAWWLAYLMWDGRLPEAMVAEGDLRELRIACRERRRVVEERGDLVRRMRSHLSQLGISLGKSDFKSVVGMERIELVVDQVRQRHGLRGEAVSRLWKRIDDLTRETTHWDGRVVELSGRFKEVELLDRQLAGVGPFLASVVWSELGDPRRYKTAKAYGKATGLSPGYRESGGRRVGGPITRAGSCHARWALTRAVLACTRCKKGPGLAVRRWVEKKKKHKPLRAVIVAAARKMAEATWRLFALGEAFDLTRSFGGPATLADRP